MGKATFAHRKGNTQLTSKAVSAIHCLISQAVASVCSPDQSTTSPPPTTATLPSTDIFIEGSDGNDNKEKKMGVLPRILDFKECKMWTRGELAAMARKELQALAKERGIKANSKSSKLIEDLLNWATSNAEEPESEKKSSKSAMVQPELQLEERPPSKGWCSVGIPRGSCARSGRVLQPCSSNEYFVQQVHNSEIEEEGAPLVLRCVYCCI